MTDPVGALVDLDGTIYRGESVIPGAPSAIDRLEDAGITPVFLSNNATKRAQTYWEKLDGFGIEVEPWQVLNSAVIAADYLAKQYGRANVYVIGEQPLKDELVEADLAVVDDPTTADIILASLDRSFDYGTLEDVLAAEHTQQPHLYATNPDRTCPVENGEIPDCKAVMGAIEGLIGRSVSVLGKPSQVTIDVALDRIGAPAEKCLMVGDRLETDIEMGERAGMTSVLVLSGVTDRETVASAAIQPDYCLDSIAEIDTVIE